MTYEDFTERLDMTVESDGEDMIVTIVFPHVTKFTHKKDERDARGDADLIRSDKLVAFNRLTSDVCALTPSLDMNWMTSLFDSALGDNVNALVEYLDDPANLVGGSVPCPNGREWIGDASWMLKPLPMGCLWAALAGAYGQHGVGESMIDHVEDCVSYLRTMRGCACAILGIDYAPSDAELLESVVNRMRA